MKPYTETQVEDLGQDADDSDLAIWVALCQRAHGSRPYMSEEEISELMWDDGDYLKNARRLLADVPLSGPPAG